MAKVRASVKSPITKKLRTLFAICVESLCQQDGTGEYGQRAIDEEAKRRNINPDILRKLRAFARPDVGYTPREFDALCRHCEKHDCEWGIRHVALMLHMPKQGGQRAKIQREAIQDGWGVSRLESEIRTRLGRRRAGDRRRAVSEDVAGLLSQIELFCEQWRRWNSDLRGDEPATDRLAGLPPAIQEKVQDANRAILALQSRVVSRLEKERRGT